MLKVGFMRGVVVESFVVGLLLLTAACVSSATASSGGGTGGMVGGGGDGSLNGSPPAMSGEARTADSAGQTADGAADPIVCATLTGRALPGPHALSQLAHQATGPLGMLVSSLVVETADGRSAADVVTAIHTVCGAQAADATAAEVCDALEQDWVAAADQTVAAGDDAAARAEAVRDLAVRAAADVAPLQQDGADDGKLTAAVRELRDGSAAQSAITGAAECAGLSSASRH